MTIQVQELLADFDQLSATDQQELVAEILRRIPYMDWPSLTDDDLAHLADERFVELDEEEAPDG